ncbi:hypothetical protein APSETT445_001451 [Aspergillus pseudonomiae]
MMVPLDPWAATGSPNLMEKVSTPNSIRVPKYLLAQIRMYKLPTSAAVNCEADVFRFQRAIKETEQDEPVKILEKQATFDEYVVWGHELTPAADDSFVKGVEEWLKLAEAVS